MSVARRQCLVDLLDAIPDPRGRRGRQHPLVGLLAVGIAAAMAGARSFTAIGQWAADAGEDVLTALGAASVAEESTFRRAFARVDADLLDAVLGAWMWTRISRATGRLVIAIDGKTVRGAVSKRGRAADQRPPHLVSALAQGISVFLGQVAVEEKSNEIPAVRDLLTNMINAGIDLFGAVITLDAMHTQTDTANLTLAHGAHYVMCVKGNTPTLRRQLKKLPWAKIPEVSVVANEGGRRVRWTMKVTKAPAWTGFTGAKQVAKLTRTRVIDGKRTSETVYLITSADGRTAKPAVLAGWVQSHWHIENRSHWVRDVTYGEDKSQVRTGNAPRVMATLHCV